MSIPSSIGLIVLGLPIIQVLLEHGFFHLDTAQSTAVPLAFFAVGLAGLAAVEILTRSFYALRDSTTPVIVSVGQFVFKIALSLILIDVAVWGAQWGMGALAFSTSIAGLLEAIILFWLLHQRVGELQPRPMLLFIGRILLASLAMGLGLFVTRFALDFILGALGKIPPLAWIDTLGSQSLGLAGTIVAFIKLLIELLVGAIIYIRVARKLGIEELGPIKRVLDRFKLSWI
jgi:putative peptidoglycan lipid II flippase